MQYFIFLLSLFLSFGLSAQDWHPFPLDMKKEYNMSENYGDYYTYFVDSIEVIGDVQKLMVGGKYLLEPFDSCSYLVQEPELYMQPVGDDFWHCNDENGILRWQQVNDRYQFIEDTYFFKENRLSYLIEEDAMVIDTVSIALDLIVGQKDTFYFQNHSVIEYVEVTCAAEGFGEILEGLEDNFKVYEFAAYDTNDEYYSDYEGQQFIFSEHYGLIDFFRFDGFYEPLGLIEMEIEGLRDNGIYYGFELNAEVYTDKFQLGNVYKWKIRGTETNSVSYFEGFARDSLIEINGNNFHFIREERLLLFEQNFSTGGIDTTIIKNVENRTHVFPINQLDNQVYLNHGYYTQIDSQQVKPIGIPIKKIDGVYFTKSFGWGGSLAGAEILFGSCCVSFGFNEGDNNSLSTTYEYSSLTGFHTCKYIDTPSTDILHTLIGFESQDTLIGDASPLATQDIIKTEQAQLTLYPNPTNEELTFEVPSNFLSAESTTVQIFNIQGQLISEQTMLLNEYNRLITSHLSRGLYTLFVKTEKGILTGRFVKEE